MSEGPCSLTVLCSLCPDLQRFGRESQCVVLGLITSSQELAVKCSFASSLTGCIRGFVSHIYIKPAIRLDNGLGGRRNRLNTDEYICF